METNFDGCGWSWFSSCHARARSSQSQSYSRPEASHSRVVQYWNLHKLIPQRNRLWLWLWQWLCLVILFSNSWTGTDLYQGIFGGVCLPLEAAAAAVSFFLFVLTGRNCMWKSPAAPSQSCCMATFCLMLTLPASKKKHELILQSAAVSILAVDHLLQVWNWEAIFFLYLIEHYQLTSGPLWSGRSWIVLPH